MSSCGGMRLTESADGRKTATWRLIGGRPCIMRVTLNAESFVAYRLPSKVQLPEVQPGTVIFDAYPDLAEARQMLPQHADLWDQVRHDFWAYRLCMIALPAPASGM